MSALPPQSSTLQTPAPTCSKTADASDGITVETCLGSMHFARRGDLCTAIGELYRAVNASNLQAAKAYFALGEMLVKSHAEMLKLDDSATMKGLMIASGVHPQKGKRATRWYATLKDPATGAFSDALYEDGAHEVAEAIKSGEQRGKVDQHGHPSVKAMEVGLGLRGQREQDRARDPRVPPESFKLGAYVDPAPDAPSSMNQMWDSIGELAGDDEPVFEPNPAQPFSRSAPRSELYEPSGRPTGATGDQMMIDFDFRAGGLAVHARLDAVAELADNGTLDPAHAAGVQRKIDQLIGYINSIDSDSETEHDSDHEHEGGAA